MQKTKYYTTKSQVDIQIQEKKWPFPIHLTNDTHHHVRARRPQLLVQVHIRRLLGSGSISGRVKPKTTKIGIHSFPA